MIMVDEKALAAPPPTYDHVVQEGSQQIIQFPEVSQLSQTTENYPPAPYSFVTPPSIAATSPGSSNRIVTQGHEAVLMPPSPLTPSGTQMQERGVALQQVQPMSQGALYQQHLLERCAAGDHDITTRRGALGIICAVMLFPIGLLCLMTDVERRCARCGVSIP